MIGRKRRGSSSSKSRDIDLEKVKTIAVGQFTFSRLPSPEQNKVQILLSKTQVYGTIPSVSNSFTGSLPPSRQTPSVSWVPITELVGDLKFLYPVMVKIEKCEEDLFVATCPTFNLSVFASSYEEALDDLKSSIAEDYNAYLGDYPDCLTNDAKDLLRLYCAFLGTNLPS